MGEVRVDDKARSAMCVDRAYHDELTHLCSDTIATQRHEIARLETWLCEWYHPCRRHCEGPGAGLPPVSNARKIGVSRASRAPGFFLFLIRFPRLAA